MTFTIPNNRSNGHPLRDTRTQPNSKDHHRAPTNDLHRHDPHRATRTNCTRVPFGRTLAPDQENNHSDSQPLATSTPRSSPVPPRNEPRRSSRDETSRASPASRDCHRSSPSKKSLRLEEEMRRELQLWNSHSNEATGPTKRRPWNLHMGKDPMMAIGTMQIPRSLTTTWTQPRTTLRMGCITETSNHSTMTNNTEPTSTTSHSSNLRMPTWITMAASSSTSHNTRLPQGNTSTSQSQNTNTSHTRDDNQPQPHLSLSRPLWHHNSLSRAIQSPTHNQQPPLRHSEPHSPLSRRHHQLQQPWHQPLEVDPQADPRQEEQQSQIEPFLSLELQPLPPLPPCRLTEQLRINISSPSLFEDSFNARSSSSPDSIAHNETAQQTF